VSTNEAQLVEHAEAIGLHLSETRAWELLFHLDMVLRANEALNLTAIRDREEAVRLHILDSLYAARAVTQAPEGEVADLGTGAGYPGIPIAIATDRETTLVESKHKKAAFLEMAASALDHDLHVRAIRSEELALARPAAYSTVTARAVTQLASLVELAAPLLGSGGWLIAMKGTPSEEEVRDGDRAAERVGMERVRVDAYDLAGGDEARTLVLYEKSGAATVELPRRPGMAQKRPLT
jgi:16S rRNA (guanine527-N7)-methyltransferase